LALQPGLEGHGPLKFECFPFVVVAVIVLITFAVVSLGIG
jgi:hypothetical protein